ncbi:Fumarylacetoacetate hydrolase family protein [hydrothermal vent metagenome]|uniref:Fumarylacetoacetate hydrolase family protein n=1 Tax=hydrothermal vent metagenome TaxID=652676 RepID=A0A3B1BBY6_9ZZZZ
MNIIRFFDQANMEQLGVEYRNGTAELLDGDLFASPAPTGQRVPVSSLLAPIIPANIYCIGLNYLEHARETGAALPQHPVVFMKPSTTVNSPGNGIHLPKCCVRGPEVDFEAELAVIIGRHAKDVAEENALDYVLGYTAANDVSARKWQKHAGGGQWIRGKSFDGFCPLGPAIVTTDEIQNPQALSIRTLLNGEVMQESNTADMIFSVARLISFLSQDTTLLPGTVILTGTPNGVGFTRKPPRFLADGDQISIEIERIGKLSNSVHT